MYSCPSDTAPLTAINKLPFFTLRESICTSRISKSVFPARPEMRTLYNMSLSFFNSVIELQFDFYRPLHREPRPAPPLSPFLLPVHSYPYSPAGKGHL